MGLVGMTIRQLPSFAARSPADYAQAMADIHARYDPVLGAGVVGFLESAQVFQVFSSWWFSAALVLLVISIVCCTLDRTPRLWRQSAEIRVVQPEPFYDPRLPDRAAMDGLGADAVAAVLRREPVPASGRRPRTASRLPLRRPASLDEAGDPDHSRRTRPLPRRRGGHQPARLRGRDPPGRRGEPAGHLDRDARAHRREELRLRRAATGGRQLRGLHHRPRGLPRRSGARPQGHPGQRPAVRRRLHVPPERVPTGARPGRPRFQGPGAVGRAGRPDRRRRRAAPRPVHRPGSGRRAGDAPDQGRRRDRRDPVPALPLRRDACRTARPTSRASGRSSSRSARSVAPRTPTSSSSSGGSRAPRSSSPSRIPGRASSGWPSARSSLGWRSPSTCPGGGSGPGSPARVELAIVGRSDRYVDFDREFGRLLDDLVAVRVAAAADDPAADDPAADPDTPSRASAPV